MYVCICHGVTDTEISNVLDAGACTPSQVAADCKAGTGCGSCVRKIRALINASSVDRGKLAVGTATANDDGRPTCEAIRRSSTYSTSS